MEQKQIDAYQVLFFLGTLSSILGISLWLFFKMRWISFFPGPAHGHLMLTAFLWPFIAGFLMTAVPRMTNTKPTNYFEMFIAIVLVFLQWTFNLRNLVEVSRWIYFLQVLFLGLYVLRRYLITRRMPFDGFVFIPFAVTNSLFLLLMDFFIPTINEISLLRISAEALVLYLIIGLGSRLIPVLSRSPSALSPVGQSSKTKLIEMVSVSILLTISYVLEVLQTQGWSYGIRSMAVVYSAVRFFDFHRRPVSFSYLSWGLKISIFFLIFGYSLLSLFPGDRNNFIHFVYIGGFSLLTLMVATRVRLAHGGWNLDHEKKSKNIAIVSGAVILANLIRVSLFGDYSGWTIVLGVTLFAFALIFWMIKALDGALKN